MLVDRLPASGSSSVDTNVRSTHQQVMQLHANALVNNKSQIKWKAVLRVEVFTTNRYQL